MEDYIYLAGLFDGEGCVGCYHVTDRKRPRLYVSIGMTDEATIDWCINLFGFGGKTIRKAQGKWKTLYRWQVVDKKAEKVLEHILPWLKTKKDTAEQALRDWRSW